MRIPQNSRDVKDISYKSYRVNCIELYVYNFVVYVNNKFWIPITFSVLSKYPLIHTLLFWLCIHFVHCVKTFYYFCPFLWNWVTCIYDLISENISLIFYIFYFTFWTLFYILYQNCQYKFLFFHVFICFPYYFWRYFYLTMYCFLNFIN